MPSCKGARSAEAPKHRTIKIVFWGAASFRSGIRGHTSVPRKAIVRRLAARGIVAATNEHGTSKHCVCGEELCDDQRLEHHEEGTRRRAHKESADPCSFLSIFHDRDELAAINILLCGIHALWRVQRSEHLRPQPRGGN